MIKIDLITPERLVFSDNVDLVVAPTVTGEIGILPKHAPLLAQLAAGEIRLTTGDTVRSVAVTGGFLEVRPGSHVEVFAETAEFAEEIDVERANQAAERAKARLQSHDITAAEMAEMELSLSRALLRLKVAGLRRHRTGAAPQPH